MIERIDTACVLYNTGIITDAEAANAVIDALSEKDSKIDDLPRDVRKQIISILKRVKNNNYNHTIFKIGFASVRPSADRMREICNIFGV
jgi:hypothetical protein